MSDRTLSPIEIIELIEVVNNAMQLVRKKSTRARYERLRRKLQAMAQWDVEAINRFGSAPRETTTT